DGRDRIALRTEVDALRSRFAHVIALAEPTQFRRRRHGNVVVAAAQRAFDTDRVSRAAGRDGAALRTGERLLAHLGPAGGRPRGRCRRPGPQPTSPCPPDTGCRREPPRGPRSVVPPFDPCAIMDCPHPQKGDMTERSEIAHEQAQIDTLYARLDELRAETRDALSTVRRSKVGGHHQNRSERDAFATMYEDALIRYQSAEEGLCFGRIDAADGDTVYIGRIGLSAQDRTQMLMDWRAPASEPFYRATAAEPGGLVRRRHIASPARTVT